MKKIERRQLVNVFVAGGSSKANCESPTSSDSSSVVATASVSGPGSATAKAVVNGNVVAYETTGTGSN